MKKTRFTETQIIKILKAQENGRPTTEFCRECGISLYPNPAGDQLFFRLDENVRCNGTLRIYDMIGRIVAERVLHGEEVIGLNVARLSAGQYLYEWQIDGKVISGKFAKN